MSRLDRKKNIEGLIEAWASSPILKTRAKLFIAGSGAQSYVDELKNKATRVGLEPGHLVWLGHVEGGEKAEALAER